MIFKSQPEDIVSFLAKVTEAVGAEFDLGVLTAGDRLYVRTENTRYLFVMVTSRTAEMSTDRPDRPGARVRIDGCAFGTSSLIKPDHLFCGGNLALLFEPDLKRHTTSAIREIRHLSCSSQDGP